MSEIGSDSRVSTNELSYLKKAPVAQPVERSAYNAEVVGSIPTRSIFTLNQD